MSSVRDVLGAAVAALDGQDRPGQIQMAEAVGESLTTGQHLLVQAGTGTGKSLGYLAPALLHEGRVVIATATLNLQHQLTERDLPAAKAAAQAVGIDTATHAVVKGRANYACLHRVREGVPDEQGALIDLPEGGLGAEVLELREWAEEAAATHGTGDRDAAPTHTDRAWRQVSVSARECLGAQRCSFGPECFAEAARAAAQDAHIVVTNHAMLAIDAIDGVPMLPEYDVVIIDEAHELAARVTQAATAELDPALIERAARRARNHLDDRAAADDLADSSEALADALTRTEPGRIDSVDQALAEALARVRDSARACLSAFVSDTAVDAARQQAKTMVEDVRQVADRMAAKGDSQVLWRSEFKGNTRLHLAPIDVAAALREKLFDAKTVVLTSATLKLGDSFDAVARQLGLDVDGEHWHGLDVGSPFDYAKQAICYVASDLPQPGRDGLGEPQLAAMADLIEAAGGRTLGLFSSRRAAEQAAEELRTRLPDIEVLCQGDAQLSELAKQFAAEPSTCLFGTLSLWQGVDLPGETCQLVIIDRIPFPRPDDPLMSARQRLIEQRGGNGFMSVSATHAALLLAQGVGRLIRRSEDKGVVAILDPRLVTARYGSYLTASLPPMWRTTDRDVARRALQRLSGATAAAARP